MNNLNILVNNLPEIYQPIFGHDNLSISTSRTCSDRLENITSVYKLLKTELGRELHVLDLGCAQGFFSLNLAKLGATVKGIDFLDKNIAVCNALAEEHSDFKIQFEVGRIENIINNLKDGEYDLVLGLSVFHHIVYEHGLEATKIMLAELAKKISIAIFEVALTEEPLYWGPSQSEKPRELLSGFSFVHELTKYNTHLSDISRPLYISSNYFWILNQQIGNFNYYKDESHRLAQGTHQLTRRYFFNDNQIIKLFLLDNQNRIELNLKEYNNEVAFLSVKTINDFPIPELILHGANESELWLVREKLAGELLLEVIDKQQSFDSDKVIKQVLKQIVALESKGLFHNDIRTWNILMDAESNTMLIDYGAISNESNDCVWPYNHFLSLMLFIHEVIEKKVILNETLRYSTFDLDLFREPYRSAFIELFKLPIDMLSFYKLQELIDSPKVINRTPSGISILSKALDDALLISNQVENHWRFKASEAEAKANEASERATEAEAKATTAEQSANEASVKATTAEQSANEASARATQAEQNIQLVWQHYYMLESSNSWKMTKPLRIVGKFIRWFIYGSYHWLTFSSTSRPRRVLKRKLTELKHYMGARPNLKKAIMLTLNHFPQFKQKLKRIGHQKVDYAVFEPKRTNAELLIDITHVYAQDLKTGIQRVVRAIVHELQKNNEVAKRFDIQPVFLTDIDGYWCYKYAKEPNIIVTPKHNDLFLGLDLNSNVTAAAQAGLFQDWKMRNVPIYFVVYDILPILHPEWWYKGVGESHEEWLRTVIESSDQLICISQSVGNDVKKYIKEHQLNHVAVGWFHLGADIDNSMPSTGIPDNATTILDKLKLQTSFLMVGTIEPRKGHKQTLLAFEVLWKNSENINLVIVGKQGWMMKDFITKLRNHPEQNKRLFWLEAISDEYLEKIYEASTCLIAASEGEGFGLPLIEAAQHKLPIIARDITVFREVAGEHAYYFPNDSSPEVLSSIVQKWLELYEENINPKSDNMPWLTWAQSAQKIIEPSPIQPATATHPIKTSSANSNMSQSGHERVCFENMQIKQK